MTKAGSKEFPWVQNYPPHLSWDTEVKVSPVFDMLDYTAQKHGDKTAFNFLGAKQNWSEIHDAVLKFAKGLQGLGVKKGMKVGILQPNCPYFIISYYALMRLGATVVNYNPLYAEQELSKMIEESETDMIITLDLELLYGKISKMLHNTRLNKIVVCRFTDVLPFPKNILFKLVKGKEISDIPDTKRVSWYHDLIDNDAKPEVVDIDPIEDIALYQFTGGTTGIPKAAMLTHANVVANTEQAAMWINCDEAQDRMLGVLPFFHVFAMTAVMNLSVKKALEIVTIPRFDLDQTLKLIEKYKPTLFPAVPAIFSAVNNHKKIKSYDLSSIEYCISGGAPLPVEVKQKFEEKTGSVVVEGYGLTESSPVLCCNSPFIENKPGSIGMPFPQTSVKLIDIETGKEAKIGERGELCAQGPQVMKGYWNRQEATDETLKDGWLHTGDIAIMDEEGYFFIVDRIKDMIITNGYNVYPRNVEVAIYQHPSVEECVVAGLPDKNRGEVVKVWIKCKPGRNLNAEDLKEFLKDKISPMEIPKRIEFREEALPKTMIGKLSRKDLLEEELAKKAS